MHLTAIVSVGAHERGKLCGQISFNLEEMEAQRDERRPHGDGLII